MTIAATASRVTYVLAGVNLGPFNTVWPFEHAADVVGYINNGAGVVKLTSGAGFAITAIDSLASGGFAMIDATYLPIGGWIAGSTFTLARETAEDQASAFGEALGFSPAAAEAALDHVDRQVQDVRGDLGRALTWPAGEATYDLPTATTRASKVLAFDGLGAPVVLPAGFNISTLANAFDSVAQASVAVISVAVQWIATAGYTVPGDLGDGLYKRVGGVPAHQAYIHSADGAYWELAENEPRPQQLGARGDGTDDAPAFQKWATYLTLKGRGAYMPAGLYRFNSTVTIDLTGHTAFLDGRAVKIRGAGPGATILQNASNSYGLRIFGDITTESCQGVLELEDFAITRLGAGVLDTGLKIEQQVFVRCRSLLFQSNTKGMVATDIISSQFYSCVWRFNTYGVDLAGQVAGSGSTPNAISFFGCSWYGQANYAVHAYGGADVNFFGGAIETTSGGLDVNRFGVKIENPGVYANCAASFHGVYFERNGNTADVWIVNGDFPNTVTFTSCSFNRVSNVDFCANPILIDTNNNTNVEVRLSLIGCAFRQLGTYVADVTRSYVKATGTTPVYLNDPGTYYNVGLERPALPSMTPMAECRFTGAGALFIGSNIFSVARTGVGAFTVTLRASNPNRTRRWQASMDIAGSVREAGQTATTLLLQCANSGGVAADPGVVNLVVYE